MEYTVQKLAHLSGVSARTLRYYDEIGLLRPQRLTASGYRIYGASQVDRLQQILFYREMGLPLEAIRRILDDPQFDSIQALKEHRLALLTEQNRIARLLDTVEKTIVYRQGGNPMSDKEKFQGLKERLIEENEVKYGREIRKKYGDEKVDASNRQLRNMSQEDYDRMEHLGRQILADLTDAVPGGEPTGELGQRIAGMHRDWLTLIWGSYNKEAHAGLARMYVEDERFAAYYDKACPGGAVFLRDAILHYTR